jgi:hypothetical protein
VNPHQKATLLLLVADRKPILDELDARADQHPLEFGNVVKKFIDLLGRRESHDAFDGSAIVPGAVTGSLGNLEIVAQIHRLGRAGQKVSVYTGDGAALPGSIERIDVVAGSLPPEFQSALRPKERKQLVNIVFETGVTPPPYFSKVSVY